MWLWPNPNVTWRVSVDYTEINKAFPKDSFALRKLDRLFGSTTYHALLSFINAYSEFH